MGRKYLDGVFQGQNQWWRYLLAILLISFFWLVLGSVPFIFVEIWVLLLGNPAITIDPASGQLAGVDPFVNYLLLSFSFITFLVGILLAVRFIHQRKIATLVTSEAGGVDWKRIGAGFAVWFVLAFLISIAEALIFPGRYVFSLQPARFLPFAALVLILTPIQTTTEEFFFRGYLMQSAGLLTRRAPVLIFLSGLLFMLPHFSNPETSKGFLLIMFYYFSFGAFMAWISLKDNSLELALGVHAANNLFAAIFANYEGSALTTPSIFTIQTIDPLFSLLSWYAAALVFWLVIFNHRKKGTAALAAEGHDLPHPPDLSNL